VNTVLIIPTGVGAEIGGHAGDGNPVAKLLAAVSDVLITHPNVVNASDINEMTENTWYVEGSMLDRFLEGEIGLWRAPYNKIVVAVNAPVQVKTINAVSAARATIGASVQIVELETPLVMTASMVDGQASGSVEGVDELINQLKDHPFDALAIVSKINVSKEVAFEYLTKGGVNPWGGVEAILSRKASLALGRPVAHAPMGDTLEGYDEVVDPRMAAELVSYCYMHCVIKGLHRAPIVVSTSSRQAMTIDDISCMVSPAGVFGPAHAACMDMGIPIIVVEENTTCRTGGFKYSRKWSVSTYLEAAGVLASIRAGITLESVRRLLNHTLVEKKRGQSCN